MKAFDCIQWYPRRGSCNHPLDDDAIACTLDVLNKLTPHVEALRDEFNYAAVMTHVFGEINRSKHGNFRSPDCSALKQRMTLEERHDEAVVQSIIHEEPAALRDEELLGLQADEDFAANVEWNLHRAMGYKAGTSTQFEESVSSENVHILRFGGGNTEHFREILLKGPQFSLCREALKNAGYTCHHQSGALVFIHYQQFHDVERALDGIELHPFHIIITETLEYLLDEILSEMPCRQRPRKKVGGRQALDLHVDPQDSAGGSKSSDLVHGDVGGEEPKSAMDDASSEYVLVVQRTFLCFAPRMKAADTVVQSTTEACTGDFSESPYARFRGFNPRRRA